MWKSRGRANELTDNKKKKSADEFEHSEAVKKRSNQRRTSVHLGIEIETCIYVEKNTNIESVGVFHPEPDESIRCDDQGTKPIEFVSREIIEFDVNASRNERYNEMLDDIRNIFNIATSCTPGKCGTHVHMSLPNLTVSEHPFLFVVIQNEWIRYYQKQSIQKFKTRESNRFSSVQTEVKSRRLLTKYTSLNLLPTFTRKLPGTNIYVDRKDALFYHVEFRGQADAYAVYSIENKTRSGRRYFDQGAFDAYIRFLANFLLHCANLSCADYSFNTANLSFLGLSHVSPRFRTDIIDSNITTLVLSGNSFDTNNLGVILTSLSKSIEVLYLEHLENVRWDDLLHILNSILNRLKICSITGAKWRDESNKQELIKSAMTYNTCLVGEHLLVSLQELTSDDYYQTAVHFSNMDLLVERFDEWTDLAKALEIIKQGNGIAKLIITDELTTNKHHKINFGEILPVLKKHHKIKDAEFCCITEPVTPEEIDAFQTFLSEHENLESLTIALNDHNMTSDQIRTFIDHIPNISSLDAPRLQNNISVIAFIVFSERQKSDRLVIENACISQAGAFVVAERISSIKTLKQLSISFVNCPGTKDVIIQILENITVGGVSNMEEFIILPYNSRHTPDVVSQLYNTPSLHHENKLNEVFHKFENASLSSEKPEKLILEKNPYFKMQGMMHLICHNVRVSTIYALEIHYAEFTSSQLETLADALRKHPLKNVYINNSDHEEKIISGILALFEVVKESTMKNKVFNIVTLEDITILKQNMPDGATCTEAYRFSGRPGFLFKLP